MPSSFHSDDLFPPHEDGDERDPHIAAEDDDAGVEESAPFGRVLAMTAGIIALALLVPVFLSSLVFFLLKSLLPGAAKIHITLISLFAGQAASMAIAWRGLHSLHAVLRISRERLGIPPMEGSLATVQRGLRLYMVSLPGLIIVTFLGQELGLTADRPAIQAIVKDALGNPLAIVLFFVVAGIGAPLFEELVFRGLFYSALRLRWGPWLAVGVTAVLFAVMHDTFRIIADYRAFPLPILYLGFVLGFIRERTQSVYPCIAVHALNNLVALFLALNVAPPGRPL